MKGTQRERMSTEQMLGDKGTVVTRGMGNAVMETIVRSFVSVESIPKPREAPTPPPKVQAEASIHWGEQANFKGRNYRDDAKKAVGFSYTQEGDKEPLKRRRVSYSEEGRDWKDIRVGNASSQTTDQYIVVREGHKIATGGWYGDCREPDAEVFLSFGHPAPQDAQFIWLVGADSVGDFLHYGQDPASPPPIEELNESQDWLDWKDRHL